MTFVLSRCIISTYKRLTPLNKEIEKMTNATIILNEACNLFEQGLLKGTGKYIKMMYLDENGNEIEKEVELPEDIHTFAGWKALGYSVKKGEKAVSKFSIWKYVKAKASEAEDANADGEASGHCIMKVAAFFSASQVQRS